MRNTATYITKNSPCAKTLTAAELFLQAMRQHINENNDRFSIVWAGKSVCVPMSPKNIQIHDVSLSYVEEAHDFEFVVYGALHWKLREYCAPATEFKVRLENLGGFANAHYADTSYFHSFELM
jgi:hypothetical protein